MRRVAITGAGGFIGQELGSVLRAAGYQVIELSRSRRAGDHARVWCLGEPLPKDLEDVDTIVHLASATLVETACLEHAAQLDLSGTRLLLEQLRRLRGAGRRRRFIFLSSQSAKPDAANAYGRSKWAIERMLDHDDEIIVRPGLVYSDRPASVFATLDKLTRLPVVPVIRTRACIQPIHVCELAESIAQLATMVRPPSLVALGAVLPLTLRDALCATAYRAGRQPPLMVSVPTSWVRLLSRSLDRLFRLTLTERVDGISSLEPMNTEDSLKVLGRSLRPFDPRELSI